MLRRTFIASAAASMMAGAARAAASAELIIRGGTIYTGVERRPRVEAVAVRGGRIVHAGGRREAEALAGPSTRVIELSGAAMFPGFVDGHAHLRGIGERELTLNLEGTRSIAELQARVRAEAAKSPAGGVLYGRGWIETGWPEKRFPTAADLDAAAPGVPVILTRADGHALVASSAALSKAGVTASTAAPSGGEILKDAAGRPTGMLVDNAMALVSRLVERPSPERIVQAYETGGRVYARAGWTGVHNMSVDFDDVAVMERLSGAGRLPLRVWNAVEGTALERVVASLRPADLNRRVTTRAIKLYADGALGSRGAALLAPYADSPESRGLTRISGEELAPILARAGAAGVQVDVHAIGDRGNRMVLDAYEAALAKLPRADRRWRIEHAQVVAPADIPRFARLGVIASMQPSHAIGDLHFAPARLGPGRLDGAYAWRSMAKAGVRLVGGSDAPVERGDPLIEFYAATARRDLKGFQGPDWRPEEALSRGEALKLFTSGAAYGVFAERELGTVEVGKRADFTAFDVDLMTAPLEAIPKGKATLTVVGGQVAHQA